MSGPAAGTLKREALDRGAGRETNCGVKLCGPRRRPSLLAGEKNCGPASQGAARLSSTYRDCYRPLAGAGGRSSAYRKGSGRLSCAYMHIQCTSPA